MPQKQIIYYAEIPRNKNYLLTNYGKVLKKSTFKPVKIINNYVRLTINGKQTTLSVSKLMGELFPTEMLIKLQVRSLIATEKINAANNGNNKRDIIPRAKYKMYDNGRGGFVKEKIVPEVKSKREQYDYDSLPDMVMYKGELISKSKLSIRAAEKVINDYNS